MMNKGAWERERLIRRQASSWYWRLKSPDLSPREREEHQRWLAVPEHQAAFKALSNDWERWQKMPWPRSSQERVAPASQTYARPAMRPSYTGYGAANAAVDTHAHVVAEEAAYWYFVCVDDSQQLQTDRREFLAWMRRSPEHIAELFKIARLDGRLRCLTQAVHEIVERPKPSSSPRLLAAAAALLMAIGIGIFVGHTTHNRMIVTQAGQWDRVTLDDGTVMHIDARTRLAIEFTSTERLVHLYEGGAAFDVVREMKRPFVVRTPLSDITAVGTRFGVSIEPGVTTTVSAGTVKISARDEAHTPVVTLQAGEELLVTDDGLAKSVVTQVNAERKLEWTTGWLTFDGETIGQAVAEFNRRNTVQIQIKNPEIAARAVVYGRFRVDSPASFAKLIAEPEGLTLFEDPSTHTLRLMAE